MWHPYWLICAKETNVDCRKEMQSWHQSIKLQFYVDPSNHLVPLWNRFGQPLKSASTGSPDIWISQKLVWEWDGNWNFSCLTTANHWGDYYKMAAVRRNADTKITLPFLLHSASLQWPHKPFSLFYHSWQQPLFLSFPQECNASSSEDKLYKAKKAQQLYVKVCQTGRKVAQGEKWGLSLKSEICCCLTFAAHLPSIPPFPKPLKAFFSLSDHFLFPLLSLFCLCRLTPAILWEEIDKNETFFQRENAEHARIK